MNLFLLKISILLLTMLALEKLLQGDACPGRFFSRAWQVCFRDKIQRNWIRVATFPSQPRPVSPTIPPIIMPNIDEIIAKVVAKAQHVIGVLGTSSSSSFTSSSSITSRSVMSANGRTWIIENDGLSISSSSTGTTRHVKVVIGDPESVQNSMGEAENLVKVNLKYGDGSTKWVKITLDSRKKVKDLDMERRNGILYITGEM